MRAELVERTGGETIAATGNTWAGQCKCCKAPLFGVVAINGTCKLCALCALNDAACDAAGGWTSKVAQDLSELDALSRVWEGGGRGGQFLQLAP